MKRTGLMLMAMAGLWMGVTTGRAEEPAGATLKVGDAAPALTPGDWIKGEPVTSFETGRVYVVEFWATWCGPCRVSIPHLSEIQARFADRGVIIIGQNCSEDDPEVVREFVNKMGEKMAYRVALDNLSTSSQGSMNTAWMEAANQQGIPTAFVVGPDGRIAWIGHPMNGLDRVLEAVLDGTYDAAAEARKVEKLEAAQQTLSSALEEGDFEKALAHVATLADLAPEQADGLKMLRFQLLLAKKDYPAAYADAASLVETYAKDANVLNEIAWVIATGDGIAQRDLDLAEKAALAANAASGGKDGAVLDTVARVYFEKGMMDKAVSYQELALAHTDEEDRPILQEALDKYRAALAPAAPAAP